jgi:hypothetical protein
MLSLAARLCFVAVIGLLVWAIVQMALSGNATPAREALVIEEPERDLGEQFVGSHTLTFRVRNTTPQPQRIIGSAEG